MATSTITAAKSTYRALLRELPRRTIATPPTPLHSSIRAMYQVQGDASTAKSSSSSDEQTATLTARLQEAEQFALYARAQRQYSALVERYNPGSWLDEEERIRLTARRVGLDLPIEEGERKD
ncbi:LYR motif-containing protein [Aspergillus homomorphus CBS 101889]|uniref:Ras guanyl-nucleotide exchange factor RasGEF n=1 Tax=Aspergillus homomorphus (strain CBS 101889) TaxID=1450537 RepID=A0A395IC28_ASPHC|nr:hypothetical protein BO97DRAFT_402152 [Aspergillus homomorphus CBS 101889]RAL17591.1 hypothetical protein BO97DRAFT_402152 [Aspergillus homomorphus CBS 101889]